MLAHRFLLRMWKVCIWNICLCALRYLVYNCIQLHLIVDVQQLWALEVFLGALGALLPSYGCVHTPFMFSRFIYELLFFIF